MSELHRVTIAVPAAPVDTAHDQRMADLADGKPPPVAAPEAPPRPAWLPEKFKTVEDLAASYKELEAKQATHPAAVTPPVETPAAVPPVDPLAVPAAATVDAAVAKAGLNLGALNAEFAKDGVISPESYAKLNTAGFDKATVDSYIAGQQALAAVFQRDVTSATPGGAERYPEMMAWAKASLSESEKDAYNAAVSSGNADKAKLAVAGLGARFVREVGNEPSLVGGRPTAGAADVYQSIEQMKADMRDPKYKTDPAYRKGVQDKLGRSDIM